MSSGLPPEVVEEILEGVPEIPRFLSAKELDERTMELAREHRGTVRIRRVGLTVQGDPILGLEVGNGDRHALFFGAAHPNEPVGTLTALHLAQGLARHEAALHRAGFQCTIVPAIDRDGLVLNERWLTSTGFNLVRFAQNYYRPPAPRQVEWTFPYFSAQYDFSATRPETVALQQIIDVQRPELVFSLHNHNVGGAFYYLNRVGDGLRDSLLGYPGRKGLPLDPVRPDEPWGRTLAPFILERLTTRDAVEFLLAEGADPRLTLRVGAGSIEYAESVQPDLLGLMAEVPLFADPRCADLSESSADRVEVFEKAQHARERVENQMRSAHQTLQREGNLHPGPFREAVETNLHVGAARKELRRYRSKEEMEADTEGEGEIPGGKRKKGPLTVAEAFHEQVLGRFLDLRLLGLTYRFVYEQAAPGTFTRDGLLRSVGDHIELLAKGLEKELAGKRAPIRHLVQVQMHAGLQALSSLAEAGPLLPS